MIFNQNIDLLQTRKIIFTLKPDINHNDTLL